ncbi:PREDICTED: DNA-directed RNA polymerase I subunit RPA12 [Ceratosolen solmsi marchali]|uniref:DNA-directed RNA polymerase subunit n=1 Tax=Ceratosolen solmsi marchali TaxID=326594 RepID=A0AAJ6VMX8_9HYME|nr:PREDICTED: DNA-directed RNA polymerase I subunit RPA12 [Ceratosolen solmsi marchali]
MDITNKASFITTAGFCPDCGSILPLLNNQRGVTCYSCSRNWEPEVFGYMSMIYTVTFNNKDTYTSAKQFGNIEELEGPIINRQCLHCNNNKMSYATLQLRSADEGQTVFYTCTKCKYKETENS